MASTAAERKAKERQIKKDQGMVLKQVWLYPETIQIIEKYKNKFDATDEDAINELIKEAFKLKSNSEKLLDLEVACW